MLAMVDQPPRGIRQSVSSLTTIASVLAPTVCVLPEISVGASMLAMDLKPYASSAANAVLTAGR